MRHFREDADTDADADADAAKEESNGRGAGERVPAWRIERFEWEPCSDRSSFADNYYICLSMSPCNANGWKKQRKITVIVARRMEAFSPPFSLSSQFDCRPRAVPAFAGWSARSKKGSDSACTTTLLSPFGGELVDPVLILILIPCKPLPDWLRLVPDYPIGLASIGGSDPLPIG